VSARAKIVAYCEWGIAHTAQIHYGQVRPLPADAMRLPLVTDCSGFATLAYRHADAPDPNGGNYQGVIYTGTLMKHGRQVKVPLPGDLIFYGDWPGHHVVVFLYEWHGAWVCCSHGQEIGPLRILQHREEVAQGLPRMIRSYLPRTP
jgi:cell wall-associated NlpC family hydrolase